MWRHTSNNKEVQGKGCEGSDRQNAAMEGIVKNMYLPPAPLSYSCLEVPSVLSPAFFHLLLIFYFFVGKMAFHLDFHALMLPSYLLPKFFSFLGLVYPLICNSNWFISITHVRGRSAH